VHVGQLLRPGEQFVVESYRRTHVIVLQRTKYSII
jgi:hypothetical protein